MALSLGTNGSREHASTPPLRGYAQHERQKSRLLPCHPFALSVAERSRRARIPRTIANLMPLPARGEGTQERSLHTNATRYKLADRGWLVMRKRLFRSPLTSGVREAAL